MKRSDNLSLKDAAVCFYGQKPANFLAVQENWHVRELLRTMQEQTRLAQQTGGEAPKFRIYNLAGNPMMVRMTESKDEPAAVDAVFELKGQKAYDVVPGAFIAQQAGAFLVDLKKNDIDLDKALRHHQVKMKYILAATRPLAEELWTSLRGDASDRSLLTD